MFRSAVDDLVEDSIAFLDTDESGGVEFEELLSSWEKYNMVLETRRMLRCMRKEGSAGNAGPRERR